MEELCCVCYDTFDTKEKTISCKKCETIMCLDCLIQFKKFLCPSCGELYEQKSLKSLILKNPHLLTSFKIFTIYNNIPFDENINTYIQKYKEHQEEKKTLRFGYVNSTKINLKHIRCITPKCLNPIFLDTGICKVCQIKICIKCQEKDHGDSSCDPNIIANLKELLQTSKQCPVCNTYITKTAGCDDMICTHCSAKFSWNRLEETRTTSNTHYTNVIAKTNEIKTYKQETGQLISKRLQDENAKTSLYKTLAYKDLDILEDYKTYITNNKFITKKPNKTLPNSLLKIFKKYANDLTTLKIEYLQEMKQLLSNQQQPDKDIIDIIGLVNSVLINKLFEEIKRIEYLSLIYKKPEIISENDYITFIIDAEELFISKKLAYIKKNNIVLPSTELVVENSRFILRKTYLSKQKSATKTFNFVEENVTNVDKSKQQIIPLDDNQVFHFNQIKNILSKYHMCIDTSYPGSGKTYSSFNVCQELNINRLIIISPKIVSNKWREIHNSYLSVKDIPCLYLSYSTIITPTFQKNDMFVYNVKTKTITFNSNLIDSINDKTLFIIDEIHNLKSDNSFGNIFIKSLSAIVREKQGFVLGLSATPFERETDIPIIIKKLGLTIIENNIDPYDDKLCKIYFLHRLYRQRRRERLLENNTRDNYASTSDSNTSENNPSSNKITVSLFDNDIKRDNMCLKNTSEIITLMRQIEPSLNITFLNFATKKTSGITNFKSIQLLINLSELDCKSMEETSLTIKENIIIKIIIVFVSHRLKFINYYNKAVSLLKTILSLGISSNEILSKIFILKNKLDFKDLDEVEKNKKLETNALLISFIENKLVPKPTTSSNSSVIKLDSLHSALQKLTYKGSIELLFLDFSTVLLTIETDKKLNDSTNKVLFLFGYFILFIFGFDLPLLCKLIIENAFISTSSAKPKECFIEILETLLLDCFMFGMKQQQSSSNNLNNQIINVNSNDSNSQLNNIQLQEIVSVDLKPSEEDEYALSVAFKNIDVKTRTTINSLDKLSLIHKGLMQIESIYIKYILQMILTYKDLNYKIVIGVHQTASITDFETFCCNNKLKYLKINGSVKNKEEVINTFQNNADEKLLIINTASLNTGVDLDDKVGDTPRLIFLIPNFRFGEMLQFLYRFKRKDSKSEPKICLLNKHVKILSNLLAKSNIYKGFGIDIVEFEKIKIISYESFDKCLKSYSYLASINSLNSLSSICEK